MNVFVLCLDRLGFELNIIDKSFALELIQAVHCAQVLAAEGHVDVVVVCSGKKSFLAGADIHHELKFVGARGMFK